MQDPGGGIGSPSGAPSGAPSLPESEKIKQHFEKQWYPFFRKFEELKDSVEIPDGYKYWSGVPKGKLLNLESSWFDVAILNPLVTTTEVATGALTGARVDLPVQGLSSTLSEKWKTVVSLYLESYGVASGTPEETTVRQQANAVLDKLINDFQTRLLEQDKQDLVGDIKRGMTEEPPSGYDNWHSVPFDEFIELNMPGIGSNSDTIRTVYEELMAQYIAVHPDQDTPENKETHLQDMRERILLTKELVALREAIEDSEDISSLDPSIQIESAINSFIAASSSPLSEADKLRISAELTTQMTGLYSELIESQEYVDRREWYFSDALMRLRKAQQDDPNLELSDKDLMWKEVVRIYVHGGSYKDAYGNVQEFDPPAGKSDEDYAWEIFNKYLGSYESFDEYMRDARLNHALSGFNREEKEKLASDAYLKEQQELIVGASRIELQMMGLIHIDVTQQMVSDYGLLRFLETERPDLMEKEAVKNFLSFFNSLDERAASVFGDPHASIAEVRSAFDALQAENFKAQATISALRRIQRKSKNPGLTDAQIEAELVRDVQGWGQQAQYAWANVGNTVTGALASDSGGDLGNKVLGGLVSWHALTLGRAVIDKMGARHRDHPFRRHWYKIPLTPRLNRGKKPDWGNIISLGFVAGEAMDLNVIGRTARLAWDGTKRDLSTLDGVADAVGALGALDFTQAQGGLTSSILALGRSADSLTSPFRHLGADIPTIGGGVFQNGKIENPEVAAKFLEDKKLGELLKLAGEIVSLQEEMERLEVEIEIDKTKLKEEQAKPPAEQDSTRIMTLTNSINTKTETLKAKSELLEPKTKELFENEQNRERIFVCLAWNQVMNAGLRSADRNKDGTMELDKHAQMKVWSVVNLTFKKAYELYEGSTGVSDLQDRINEYSQYLEEVDPNDPEGKRMRRTKFADKYAQFMFGYEDSDVFEDFSQFTEEFKSDPTQYDTATGTWKNPFLRLGMETGTPFVPKADRDLLRHHVTANNLVEKRSLFTSVMEYVGNPPKAIFMIIILGQVIKMATQGNKKQKAAIAALFPTIFVGSNIIGRLFTGYEDIPEASEDPEVADANMLDQPPKNRNKLMEIVFKDHKDDEERRPKEKVNLIKFVEEMKEGKMTIIPESSLLKELKAARGRATGGNNMNRDLNPERFSTDGRMTNLVEALEDSQKGIKQIYEALKLDLEAAAAETSTKGNPLTGVKDAYEKDKQFVDIHSRMGRLVTLSQNKEVNEVELQIKLKDKDSPETFMMRFGRGKNSNKRDRFASWWEEDNETQYDKGDGTAFVAQNRNETAAFHDDFQIYHKTGEGFLLRWNQEDFEIEDIVSVEKKLQN